MLAQVAEGDVGDRGADKVAGRRRDENLPAVSGPGDAGGADDVEAVVSRLGEAGLPGVDADSDTNRGAPRPAGGSERLLRLDGRPDAVARPSIGEEERVPLGVDLLPAVLLEGGPDERVVLLEERSVFVSELTHEPRRALDVGEQERDRAGRDGRAGAIYGGRRGRQRLVLFQDRPLQVP